MKGQQTHAPRTKTEAHAAQMQGGQAFPFSLILDILKRQIAISTGFLMLLQEEKKALVNMDMNSLISLTRKKEYQLTKIAQLDHSLQEVAAKIIAQAQDKGNDTCGRIIKLAELIPFMNRDQVLTIKKYRDQLAGLREKIADNNLINKRFTSDTLGYINDAISLLCGDIIGDRLYSTPGKKKATSSLPALVSREV